MNPHSPCAQSPQCGELRELLRVARERIRDLECELEKRKATVNVVMTAGYPDLGPVWQTVPGHEPTISAPLESFVRPGEPPARVFLFFDGGRMAPGIELDEQAAALHLKLLDPSAVSSTPPPSTTACEYRLFRVVAKLVWDSEKMSMVSVGDWNTDLTPPIVIDTEIGGKR